jgi:proteasome lid subunit RPN8/RPN11
MWEKAKDIITNPETFNGKFVLPRPVLDSIKHHAAKQPNKETGGMLFGQINENNNLEIVTSVVHNICENKSSSTSTYFGIKPEYTNKVIRKYEPDHIYLGNWHSHLGYGGPSSGDRKAVKEFFEANQARDITVDFIMDRESKTELKYRPIIDVYRRKQGSVKEYHTSRVDNADLIIPDGSKRSVIITDSEDPKFADDTDNDNTKIQEDTTGEPGSDISNMLEELAVDEYGVESDDIRKYRNDPLDEQIVLLPVSYRHNECQSRQLDVVLKVSFPDDRSDATYVDLTSSNLEKQITVKKIPTEEIHRNTTKLKESLDQTVSKFVPKLLERPTWEVLDDQNNQNTSPGDDKARNKPDEVDWELCQS